MQHIGMITKGNMNRPISQNQCAGASHCCQVYLNEPVLLHFTGILKLLYKTLCAVRVGNRKGGDDEYA